MSDDDFAQRVYSAWLEEVVRMIFEKDPVCMQFQMRDEEGETYVSFWNVSANDRAIMVDAVNQEAMLSWVIDNRDTIAEILSDGWSEDEDGEDG